jgi:hypothetical protein
MTVPVLTTRALNRATLARQMLLERSDMPIAQAAEFLGGLQAQQSNDPYIGLWSRLNGFRQQDLTALIVDRTLNRATTMRGTLHLHTADDLFGFRALVQPFLSAQWKSNFLKRFGGEDKKAVIRAGIRLLNKGPMTAGALNKKLKEKFPSAEPIALSALLAVTETLVQIPPTRIWGTGSAPILTRVENWLPPPHQRPLSREDLVRRYLRAFGPASVADMATWCRLTKLGAEFKKIASELIVFQDEAGRTLYDVPDAPRPHEETPAPVRFLPLYDNVYLGYDDRRRMLSEETVHLMSMFQSFKPAVLIDGTINAGWTVSSKKDRATLEIELYRTMSKRELKELEQEGQRFIRFLEPEAGRRDVAFTSKF